MAYVVLRKKQAADWVAHQELNKCILALPCPFDTEVLVIALPLTWWRALKWLCMFRATFFKLPSLTAGCLAGAEAGVYVRQ